MARSFEVIRSASAVTIMQVLTDPDLTDRQILKKTKFVKTFAFVLIVNFKSCWFYERFMRVLRL